MQITLVFSHSLNYLLMLLLPIVCWPLFLVDQKKEENGLLVSLFVPSVHSYIFADKSRAFLIGYNFRFFFLLFCCNEKKQKSGNNTEYVLFGIK